jgi:DNA-binding NtrC family response regulator
VKDQLESLVSQMIDRGLLFEEAISEFERIFFLKVLEKNQGNQSRAARAMGIHRNTLNKKLASYIHPKSRTISKFGKTRPSNLIRHSPNPADHQKRSP